MPRMNKVGGTATTVERDTEKRITRVTYHSTCVVSIDWDKRELQVRHGGWITYTTTTRINQALSEAGLPFSAGRCKGVMTLRSHKTQEDVCTVEAKFNTVKF